MKDFTPREIVAELDRHIVGQTGAKRAVAIALRNRWRRKQTPDAIRSEITPKNILMIGPTGVGKTEVSRRLAKLANAPFLKVEATKFTEVGYVGRDVEQIIRDLVEAAVGMVRDQKRAEVAAKAQDASEERLLDALVGSDAQTSTREVFRRKLRSGELDDKEVDIEIADSGPFLQKLRIRDHIEGQIAAAFSKGGRHCAADLIGGTDRHGGLVDDDLVGRHVGADGARHAQHVT